MADDIYKVISIPGVSQAQCSAINDALDALDKRPMDVAVYEYSAATKTFSVSVGIPSETALADVSNLLERISVTITNIVGKAPNSAVDIAKGVKCTTARDRQKEIASSVTSIAVVGP